MTRRSRGGGRSFPAWRDRQSQHDNDKQEASQRNQLMTKTSKGKGNSIRIWRGEWMESARGTEGTRLFERKHEEVQGGGRKDLREKKKRKKETEKLMRMKTMRKFLSGEARKRFTKFFYGLKEKIYNKLSFSKRQLCGAMIPVRCR